MEATTELALQRKRVVLKPAVLGTRKDLSPAGQAELRALMGPRTGRYLVEWAGAWFVIALAIWVAIASDNWLVKLLAICVISSRQLVLALLLHEQVHHLGIRGKWGDTLVNLFVIYPLMASTVEDYSEVHLRHHRHFMTTADPDFIRKSGAEWTFPMSWLKLLGHTLLDISGLNTVRFIRGKTAPAGEPEFRRPYPTPRWVRPVYMLALFAVVTWLGVWTSFLLYWVLPVMTLTQVGIRWIAVVEHEYGHEGSEVNEVTPVVCLKWWEKIFIPDLNFAMHVYHHDAMGVSFSKLPDVHKLYVREGLVNEDAVFDGAMSYLRFLCGGPQGKLTQEMAS